MFNQCGIILIFPEFSSKFDFSLTLKNFILPWFEATMSTWAVEVWNQWRRSGTYIEGGTLRTKAKCPLNGGWAGVVNNNPPIEIFFFYSANGICSSHYFKQLDNVLNVVINLSPGCCVLNSHKCSTWICEIVHVLKAVAMIVPNEHSLTYQWYLWPVSTKVSPGWRLNLGFGTPE